ncbi:MAG TPA: hypothetical protein VF481_14770 [Novosphingobium sp.]
MSEATCGSVANSVSGSDIKAGAADGAADVRGPPATQLNPLPPTSITSADATEGAATAANPKAKQNKNRTRTRFDPPQPEPQRYRNYALFASGAYRSSATRVSALT